MKKDDSFKWPTNSKGEDAPTVFNEILKIHMCRKCWNGEHKRDGCTSPGCQCGCYHGSSRGLNHARPPAKGCKEQEQFPDVGTITLT